MSFVIIPKKDPKKLQNLWAPSLTTVHISLVGWDQGEGGGEGGGLFPGAERGGCCRWLWWHGEPARQGGDADSAVTAALPPSQVSDSLPQGLTLHIAAVSL